MTTTIDRRELKDAYRAFANFEHARQQTLDETTYDAGIEAWLEMKDAYESIIHIETGLRRELELEWNMPGGARSVLAYTVGVGRQLLRIQRRIDIETPRFEASSGLASWDMGLMRWPNFKIGEEK